MGSGASSNVKEIIIDQNDNKWDQYKGRRGNSSSSKRSASLLSKRLLQGTRSTSVERKRNEEMRSILATTEKKLFDAEDKIRNLQRELCTFELRNNELLDETIWLKQQIGQPEVPLLLRSSNDISTGITESERRLREELEKCKHELEDRQKSHEDRITRLTNEYGQKIALIQGELLNEKIINKKLNAVIDKYRKAEDRRRINEALISVTSPSSSEVIATPSYTPPHSSIKEGKVQAMTNYMSGSSEIDNDKKLTMEDEDYEDDNTNMPSMSAAVTFQSKVIETPRSAGSVRPATADTTISNMRWKESQDACKAIYLSSTVMRGSSAPMLFTSRSRAHRLQRSYENAIQTNDDSHSTHYSNIEQTLNNH